MAQLSDDCFAFGGPMMSVDEAVAHHRRAGHGGAGDRDRCARRRPTGAFSRATSRRRCRCRLSPIPPSTAMPCASRDLPRDTEQAFPVTGRVQAGASARRSDQAGPRGADLHRRADARGRRHRVHAGGRAPRRRRQGRAAAGLKPGANVRPAGEDIAAGHAALQAGQRLRPQDVALAAAFGLTQLEVTQAHPRRGVFDRQRTGIAGRAARGRRNCSIPTASC